MMLGCCLMLVVFEKEKYEQGTLYQLYIVCGDKPAFNFTLHVREDHSFYFTYLAKRTVDLRHLTSFFHSFLYGKHNGL